jgi:hypothetical protein
MADQTPPPADPRATAARAAPPTASAASAPAPSGTDAASSDLDRFVDTHMRNSRLSQRTDLYNEAQGHIQALKQLFSNAG